MAITYSAQNGTQITSALVGVANLAAQTGAANQVQIPGATSAIPSNATDYNSNVGNGTNGLGDTYVGRLCMLRKGLATEEIRIITAASGTTTHLLTVNEDWDTAPTTNDDFDICYEPGDIEDGGAGGGINLNSKSGLYELSNTLTINSTGFFQIANGNALELDDDGNNVSFLIQSGGYFIAGLQSSGADISGGVMPSYNGATGEPSTQIASGGNARVYDTLIWAQLVAQQYECANGSDGRFYRTKWLKMSDELFLYDATVRDCSVNGLGSTTDIVRVDAGTDCVGFVIANMDTLDSAADTTTETIELSEVLFAGVTDYINVRSNKTWNLIDPVWGVTTYTDMVWVGSTSNVVNDRRSVTATVQEADGTKLQSALVNVYENTQLADLVLELTTDTDGLAVDSFIYKAHATNSTTTTYGGHALQSGKWLYLPFVAAQVSTEAFTGTIVLSPDSNIVQTTQATAKSAGSTITWNEDTNPSDIFGFDTGSGTLAVGMILTFSGGAVGTITESKDGDSVSGVLHLKDRNATAIGATDTFSRTGGTAGTFSGTCNASVNAVQSFSIWIDAQTLSYQTVYDYLAAIQNETTLTADGELIWEWCRSAQTQPLYATGSSFFTERSNSKGIMIVDGGAGTVDYFTDDAGVTWTAPATVTVQVEVLNNVTGLAIENANVQLYLESDFTTVVLRDGTNASGIASTSYSYTADTAVTGWARQFDVSGTDYVQKNIGGTITSSGLALTTRLDPYT